MDYTIEGGNPPTIEEQMRYLAGFGVHAQQTLTWGTGSQPVIGDPTFLHGDLTRSTMMNTNPAGAAGFQDLISGASVAATCHA